MFPSWVPFNCRSLTMLHECFCSDRWRYSDSCLRVLGARSFGIGFFNIWRMSFGSATRRVDILALKYVHTYIHKYLRTYVRTYVRTYLQYLHTDRHTYIIIHTDRYLHTYIIVASVFRYLLNYSLRGPS